MSDKEDLLFTPKRCGEIVSAISNLIPKEVAAEASGISYERLKKWFSKANDDVDNDYTQFFVACRKAEMQCIKRQLDLIEARPDNWQAHAWLLEKSWSEFYDRPKKT